MGNQGSTPSTVDPISTKPSGTSSIFTKAQSSVSQSKIPDYQKAFPAFNVIHLKFQPPSIQETTNNHAQFGGKVVKGKNKTLAPIHRNNETNHHRKDAAKEDTINSISDDSDISSTESSETNQPPQNDIIQKNGNKLRPGASIDSVAESGNDSDQIFLDEDDVGLLPIEDLEDDLEFVNPKPPKGLPVNKNHNSNNGEEEKETKSDVTQKTVISVNSRGKNSSNSESSKISKSTSISRTSSSLPYGHQKKRGK
jgi:hypothetical protein